MRRVTPATTAAWRGEVKAGPTAPVVRATTQRVYLGKYPYNTEDEPGGDYDKHRQRTGFYRTILFGHGGAPREIPNIKRCEWARSLDQDVATCTLTISNTQLIPIGSAESADLPDDFEARGYLAYDRGRNPDASARWGYGTPNPYTNFLIPDRMVKTYEGYGADWDQAPGDDENLYISGSWLIDEVSYNANGDIALSMRDLGRLLLDHIAFPPIVPYADYPMQWSKITTRQVDAREATGGSWAKPTATTHSSNDFYVGKGIVDRPPYVESNGSVRGHGDAAVLSERDTDYWLSTGQVSAEGYVWWQEEFSTPQDLAAVRIKTFGGPYKVYVSVGRRDSSGITWLGRREIPYRFGQMNGSLTDDPVADPDASGAISSVNIHAGINFIETDVAERAQEFDIVFRRKYQNVDVVRITLTRLRRMTARNYPWRGGLHSVKVYRGSYGSLGFDNNGTANKPVGNYSDFTDIVKWVCSWTGWWWPQNEQDNWINYRDTHDPGDRQHYPYGSRDTTLVKGRVWGSFQQTGTAGIADLTSDQFAMQPLMTAIQKVREIVGYQFLIDEAGGVVWRRPNIWSPGNYISRGHKSPRHNPDYVAEWMTVDDERDLLQYETRHSSRNLRERIFVGSANGRIGAVVRGYSPLPHTGLRRVAGWLDENWKRKRQALVAGDLIAARQMFDYRRSRWTIWGNPAVQIDDQIRIYERTTNETFYHYVIGISSVLDMEQGTWDYSMESHWLGPDIDAAFVVDPATLQPATRNYLNAIGGEK